MQSPAVQPYPLAPRATAAGPLDGLGVLVTRPARQAEGFANRLAALGARAVVWPAIVILPPQDRAALERAHATLARYDLAFFVSANAVEYGAPPVGRWPASLPAYAPGPGTAEALVAVGVADVHVPATSYDSEGLLALPALRALDGKRAVIFRGEGGRELLADELARRGASVDAVACYRRAAPATDPRGLVEAIRDGRVDALTFTSSEGADNLLERLDARAHEALAALPAFAPHPRIAARLADLGLDARLTAGGDAGLLAGLIDWARTRSPTDAKD